jgi:hypothetical protein
MALNNCPLCLDKQRRIDELEDEVKSLRAVLGREQRKMEDGFFGSSTPSSKKNLSKRPQTKKRKSQRARVQATRDMVGMDMEMGRKIVRKTFFLRLKHALNAANC